MNTKDLFQEELMAEVMSKAINLIDKDALAKRLVKSIENGVDEAFSDYDWHELISEIIYDNESLNKIIANHVVKKLKDALA